MLEKWGLERRHLLLLFLVGMASRGVVKTLLGANASLALLVAVALYYLYTKRQSETLYDEAARLQVQAAAKLDAIHGITDPAPLSNAEKLAMRQTHFQLNETDRMIITDRIHQYSNKMSGSHKDRRKFLAASRKRRTEAEAEALAEGKRIEDRTEKDKAASESLRTTDRETSKIVEEAVDATL